ncbi:MAG: hypothetical protein AAFZ80_08820 [Cyanobacteria bacterium P01_A01_bin.105]
MARFILSSMAVFSMALFLSTAAALLTRNSPGLAPESKLARSEKVAMAKATSDTIDATLVEWRWENVPI